MDSVSRWNERPAVFNINLLSIASMPGHQSSDKIGAFEHSEHSHMSFIFRFFSQALTILKAPVCSCNALLDGYECAHAVTVGGKECPFARLVSRGNLPVAQISTIRFSVRSVSSDVSVLT